MLTPTLSPLTSQFGLNDFSLGVFASSNIQINFTVMAVLEVLAANTAFPPSSLCCRRPARLKLRKRRETVVYGFTGEAIDIEYIRRRFRAMSDRDLRLTGEAAARLAEDQGNPVRSGE